MSFAQRSWSLDGVDAQADDLRVALVELGLELRHVAELGRADRREVLGMREQDRPARRRSSRGSGSGPPWCLRREVGCFVANAQWHVRSPCAHSAAAGFPGAAEHGNYSAVTRKCRRQAHVVFGRLPTARAAGCDARVTAAFRGGCRALGRSAWHPRCEDRHMENMESIETSVPNRLAELAKCGHGGCTCTVESARGSTAATTARRWPTATTLPAEHECGCGHPECAASASTAGDDRARRRLNAGAGPDRRLGVRPPLWVGACAIGMLRAQSLFNRGRGRRAAAFADFRVQVTAVQL